MDRPTYLIISTSANALVRSATRAGYAVYSIDCYKDIDTQAFCIQSFKVDLYNSNSVLDELLRVINDIGASKLDAIILGSGFEHQMEVVQVLSAQLPVVSNSAQVLKTLSSPKQVFSILDELGILFPAVIDSVPEQTDGWLLKSINSAGGYGVVNFSREMLMNDTHYIQKSVTGYLISINCIATEKQQAIFGFNEHWCCDASKSDYRYAGAISHLKIASDIKQKIDEYATKVIKAFGLRGLCGMDFMIDEQQQVLLLDINPRPTATMELYETLRGDLFLCHIEAIQNNDFKWPCINRNPTGHLVVFSDDDIMVPDDFSWPDWTACRPHSGTMIKRNEPLCMLSASEKDPVAIKDTLFEHKHDLLQRLN